jgi:hypothetical protein
MGWMPEKALEMFDKLVGMALRLGRDPSFKEVEQDPTMPHPNDFAYYFGSFSEALKQAHRTAFVYKKRETQLPPGKIFSDEEEEAMSRQAIPDQEYVVGIMRLKKELGRFPTILEMNNDRRSPSVTSYQRRFGANWSAMPKIIKQRAEDLGITEDNYEQFVVEKPVPKPKPVPALNPEPTSPEPKPVSAPEPDENPLADISVPTITKYNPEEDDADGEGVADGILGPEEEQVTDSFPVTEAESVPEPEAELMKNTPASLPILSELASDPVLPTEVEPEGNKLISLLPQTRILEPKVEGYASVFVTKGLVPLQKTVVGVPVSRNYCGLNLILNGRTIPFPEPSENVFYIVERKIASVAKAAGRETYDLLIPEKYDRDENDMKITEFSIL